MTASTCTWDVAVRIDAIAFLRLKWPSTRSFFTPSSSSTYMSTARCLKSRVSVPVHEGRQSARRNYTGHPRKRVLLRADDSLAALLHWLRRPRHRSRRSSSAGLRSSLPSAHASGTVHGRGQARGGEERTAGPLHPHFAGLDLKLHILGHVQDGGRYDLLHDGPGAEPGAGAGGGWWRGGGGGAASAAPALSCLCALCGGGPSEFTYKPLSFLLSYVCIH